MKLREAFPLINQVKHFFIFFSPCVALFSDPGMEELCFVLPQNNKPEFLDSLVGVGEGIIIGETGRKGSERFSFQFPILCCLMNQHKQTVFAENPLGRRYNLVSSLFPFAKLNNPITFARRLKNMTSTRTV